MAKVIEVGELEQRLRSVLTEVRDGGAEYVLAQDSQPEAVLIPYSDFVRYRRLREEAAARFAQLRARLAEQNADFSDEEVEADVEMAMREVRATNREPKS